MTGRSAARWLPLVLVSPLLCASQCGFIFLPPGDNTTACQNISTGSELAARVAFRGRTVKLNWDAASSSLDESTSITKLTLIGVAANDGYVVGDTNARFEITLQRENGLDIGEPYVDQVFEPNKERRSFNVKISSSPSVNALATLSATGVANVTDYLKQGDRLKIRVNFTVQVLNQPTVTVDNICGEAFFDGNLTIID